MKKFNENEIKKTALKLLENGRPTDKNHALKVAEIIKKMLKTEKGNYNLLITTAYFHDVGYTGIYKPNKKILAYTAEYVKNLQAHMTKGAKITRKALEKLDYEKDFVNQVCYFISIHDNWGCKKKYPKSNDIKIFVDADQLSKIDSNWLKSNIENPIQLLEKWKKEMKKRIKTKTGKKLLKEKIKKLVKEFKSDKTN